MNDTPLTDAHVRQLADGLAHPHWVAFARGLERDNQVLREEVKQQAICNGAGGSRELALQTTIAELQRENADLRAKLARLDGLTNWVCSCGGTDCKGQEQNVALRAEIKALKKDAICRRRGIPDRAESARIQNLTEAGDKLFKENAALRAVFEAAKALTDYEHEGAALGWPHWDSRFDALKSAIDAARKEQP